jgi:urease accessory protein
MLVAPKRRMVRNSPGHRLPGLLTITLSLLLSSPAAAHIVGGTLGGFQSGFSHPIFGADHLLAMLAVGIWGAQMGGRAVWTLPVTFPLIMAMGGVAGMTGLLLPHVELGIALSVLGLGLAIALAWKPAEIVALLLIAIFAIFHGYSHGVELPKATDPTSYAIGFVVATGLIHIAGIGIGLLLKHPWDGKLACGLGAGIAAAGIYFAVG